MKPILQRMTIEYGLNLEITFRDGNLIPFSEQSVVALFDGKSGAFLFHCVIELQENEYIKAWTKNFAATINITLTKFTNYLI